MGVGWLQVLRVETKRIQVGEQLHPQLVNLFFNLVFFKPFLLQVKLQLQTFHLHLALPLMLKNLCIWLSMLRRCYVPRACSVCGRFVDSQR